MNTAEMHALSDGSTYVKTLKLRTEELDGIQRICEPVTTSIPFEQGRCNRVYARIFESSGYEKICQTRVVARWPDGSIQWLLVCFEVSLLPRQLAEFEVRMSTFVVSPHRPSQTVACVGSVITVGEDLPKICFQPGDSELFTMQTKFALGTSHCFLECGLRNCNAAVRVESVCVEENGPLYTTIGCHGTIGRRLRFVCRCQVFLATHRVRVTTTLHNPARARHRGGYWDLGDPASVLLRNCSIAVDTCMETERRIVWKCNADAANVTSAHRRLLIYQDSSGGENWDSRNHVNRHNRSPLSFRGYRIECGTKKSAGKRASPIVALQNAKQSVACSLVDFWQRFPSAVEADGSMLRASLLPRQFQDYHELQGGEQFTREVWLQFGPGGSTPYAPLDWTHSPQQLTLDPRAIAESGVIPFFSSPAVPQRAELQRLMSEAVEGKHCFFAKREEIDEYGWRNYGDVWADHENVYYGGGTPVISHDNNQYDLLHSMLICYLESRDVRWWKLADPLARHILDIDIYHTDQDKSAYSGGLFWHTAHYQDAATSSHRSYSRKMKDQASPTHGGGPSNEHNYATGLLLYYYLTGDRRAREAVLELANWVTAMDDGSLHFLGVACESRTGAASCTRSPENHLPGRGVGNSINCLMDGWLVSGDTQYLCKTDELIRRTIHPHDDIDSKQLLDVEQRWSYTIQLQSLVRVWTLTAEVKEFAACRQYCRAALLHYAEWMTANEQLYLDQASQLEYPTETWAAQDLRKGNVLLCAAQLATSMKQSRLFRRRGEELLDSAWQQLMAFPTRACTRPLGIVLQQGYIEAKLRQSLGVSGGFAEFERDGGDTKIDFGQPAMFMSQKQQLRKELQSLAGVVRMLKRLSDWQVWRGLGRRSWTAQRMRRFWD